MRTPYPVKELDEFTLSGCNVLSVKNNTFFEATSIDLGKHSLHLYENANNFRKIEEETLLLKIGRTIKSKLKKKKAEYLPGESNIEIIVEHSDRNIPKSNKTTDVICSASKDTTNYRPNCNKKPYPIQPKILNDESILSSVLVSTSKPRINLVNPTQKSIIKPIMDPVLKPVLNPVVDPIQKPVVNQILKSKTDALIKIKDPQLIPGYVQNMVEIQKFMVDLIFRYVDMIVEKRCPQLLPYKKYMKVTIILFIVTGLCTVMNHMTDHISKWTIL